MACILSDKIMLKLTTKIVIYYYKSAIFPAGMVAKYILYIILVVGGYRAKKIKKTICFLAKIWYK